MTLDQILTEIKERADKATEGPWETTAYSEDNMLGDFYAVGPKVSYKQCEHDAIFVAHARTDVPRLVSALAIMLSLPLDIDHLVVDGEAINLHTLLEQILTGAKDE